ncbi:MAG: hypothetical protein AAF985_26180, partial [Bacteroidota bacterium]
MNSKDGTLQMNGKILRLLYQIDDKTYQTALPVFSGSSLGSHFRHILNFYDCLLNGIKEGIVDYSCRERSVKIETKTLEAQKAFIRINETIVDLDDDMPITVRADFSGHRRPLVTSSVGRELMFVFDHAIHHLAIIKMGIISHFPEIELDEELGLAPSTLK